HPRPRNAICAGLELGTCGQGGDLRCGHFQPPSPSSQRRDTTRLIRRFTTVGYQASHPQRYSSQSGGIYLICHGHLAVFPRLIYSPRWSNLHSAQLYRRRIARGRDRKSTRLNSSHVSISYAVFCLKKKKKACDYLV